MEWWKRTQRGPQNGAAGPRHELPRGVWTRCAGCAEVMVEPDLRENLGVCPRCNHHHPLPTPARLNLLVDPDSFEPLPGLLEPLDPLGFKDSRRYADRLVASRKKTGYADAALAGRARVAGRPVCIGALAFEFMGGSMGSVVGELITRVFETALQERCPALVSSASGGARMQEGILSLMQMAKTSAALRRLKDANIPYISILHHPTTGGVAASFAMQGDVILAEPGALIGFAGPRVIEQTIRQTLPQGFQRSEFLLEHGMLDMIVSRPDLRKRLGFLLQALYPGT